MQWYNKTIRSMIFVELENFLNFESISIWTYKFSEFQYNPFQFDLIRI